MTENNMYFRFREKLIASFLGVSDDDYKSFEVIFPTIEEESNFGSVFRLSFRGKLATLHLRENPRGAVVVYVKSAEVGEIEFSDNWIDIDVDPKFEELSKLGVILRSWLLNSAGSEEIRGICKENGISIG